MSDLTREAIARDKQERFFEKFNKFIDNSSTLLLGVVAFGLCILAVFNIV